MLGSKSHVLVFVIGALLIAGDASAAGTKDVPGHSRHHNKHTHHSHHVSVSGKASPREVAHKIMAFKPGDSKSEASHFDFENYSFTTLDSAARRLFPSGTKLSYVDTVLKEQGKAVKSNITGNGFVHYDYPFSFDRFACRRTVLVSFDSQTNRVISARGDGRCD